MASVRVAEISYEESKFKYDFLPKFFLKKLDARLRKFKKFTITSCRSMAHFYPCIPPHTKSRMESYLRFTAFINEGKSV